jgi:L-lysine epsilon oxidase-like protein
MTIGKVRIFPPIGIARLGNSENGYFTGPETPGDPLVPAGGYRDSDAAGFIKRQAARFHLFAYDENDALIGEITADQADISWTVHIANTKAAAERFHPKSVTAPPLRNATFQTNRNQLLLDPGSVSIAGKNPDFSDLAKSKAMNLAKDLTIDQLFLNASVRFVLGTVTIDDQSLLLVLGGHGESKSPIGASLSGGDFADHDGWYDDVSDGVVSASVKLKDGSTPEVLDAWVIVAPPKYAPGLRPLVTLYDTLEQSAISRNLMASLLADPQFKPSFTKHVYPILLRAANMHWVYSNGSAQFSLIQFHRFLNNVPPANRAVVFSRLSKPSPVPGNPGLGGDMPRMWSDLYPSGPNGTLTATQYHILQMWKDGNFLDDWNGSPGIPPAGVTPEGLTRAALEPCVGGAFFPGIEASWKLRDEYSFVEAFRLDSSKVAPGDITKQMSLPWQSDFLDCAVEAGDAGMDLVWWPSQRPIDVLSAQTGDNYISWARASAASSTEMNVDQMVTDWYRLGFLLKQPNGRYEEVDRL